MEGLEGSERPLEIQVEHVLTYASELEVDEILVAMHDELEVLDGGLIDTAVEVQDECLDDIIPLGLSVEEDSDSIR